MGEPCAFLLGVPPMEDYLSFVVQAAGGEDVDMAAAGRRWRAAAEVVASLAVDEAGAADGHAVAPVPEPLAGPAAAFLAEPAVAASYVTSDPVVGVVPLGALVAPQRQVNLRYAGELGALAGATAPPSSGSFFDFCMRVDQPEAEIRGLQTGGNRFVFSSRSMDTRFLGARLTEAANVAGQCAGGRPVAAVVLYVGHGVNAISVLSIEGRLVISNGSHRCYALLAAGATHALAVVQRLSSRSELAVDPSVQRDPGLYLESPRPPMLKDFLDPRLVATVDVPPRMREIRLQFGMEQTEAPG
jgi:hypothetical protein